MGVTIIDTNADDPMKAQCIVCLGHRKEYTPLLEKIYSSEDRLFVEDSSQKTRKELNVSQIAFFASKNIIKHLQGWDHPEIETWKKEVEEKNKKICQMMERVKSPDEEERREAIIYLGALSQKLSNSPTSASQLSSAIHSPSHSQEVISNLIDIARKAMVIRKNRTIAKTVPMRQESLINTISPHLNQKYKIFLFVGGRHIMKGLFEKEAEKLKKVLQKTSFCIFQGSVFS